MSKKITIELTYDEYDKLMEIFTEKIKKSDPNATFQEFLNNFFKMSLNSHYQIMNMTDNMFSNNSNIAEIFDQFKNSFGAFDNEPSISDLMEFMQKMNPTKKEKKEQKNDDSSKNKDNQKEKIYKS